ncbi:MAG: hypothetical protein PVH93_08140 [Nitrosopumilaceae archaeon]|jgi:hypothetical protein
MSEQIFLENHDQESTFWKTATKYASAVKEDENFVNEIAYLMVTLHRTGA